MLITSRANERVKQVRALRDRKARDISGAFFAEGRRLIQAALDTEAVIELLVGIQVLNGFMLPVILLFILRLINNEELAGDLRNTKI